MTTIDDELRKCESFVFSVAFFTLGGITPLLQTLKELEEKKMTNDIIREIVTLLYTHKELVSSEGVHKGFQKGSINEHEKTETFRKSDVWFTIHGSICLMLL